MVSLQPATMDLNQLRATAEERIAAAGSLADLEAIETEYLGRKGELTSLMRSIGALPAGERPGFGQRVNGLKEALNAAITARREALAATEAARRLQAEAIDISLPGRAPTVGRRHPLSA